MPRPKQCAYEDSAKGKIESAFWTILEDEGFNSVTMLRLAQKSSLNRNTIYYHFDNVQEISLFAFNNIFTYETGQMFINVILSDCSISSSVLKDSELRSVIKKIHLFAKSGSPLLTAIVKESLKKAWFSYVGIFVETLTTSDKMQIEYIVSGFTSVIGNSEFIKNFSVLKTLPDCLIGKAAINTLREIAARQH